jgi:hypothetical protein
MRAILYVLAILGALAGFFALFTSFDALTAIAFAVLPYCLARAVDGLMHEASKD